MPHYLIDLVYRILKQPSNSVLLASGGNVLTASRAALQIYSSSRLHLAGGVVTEYSASPYMGNDSTKCCQAEFAFG